MHLTFIGLIVLLFVVFTENEASESSRYSRYSGYNRKRSLSFWDDDEFDDSQPKWFSRRYRQRKYTKLLLNRQMFYYWENNYDKWSNWTSCSPKNCTKSRFRKCKDNSWEENVIDFRLQKKCPVKFIYEKMSCIDIKQCEKANYSKNLNISIFPVNCGIKPMEIENKIIGGEDSSKNAWPWHIGLYVNVRKRPIYICGGTLINPGWVITAAHCLKTIEAVNSVPLGEMIDTRKYDLYDKFHVVINDHDRSTEDTDEITRKLSYFIINPLFRADYSSNLYDIALLKLDQPVIPSKAVNINFPCVPQVKNYTLNKTAKCYAIGWGNIEKNEPYNIWSFEFDFVLERWRKNKPQKNSNILQEVEIPLVNFELCQKRYRIFNLNKDIHLCAGTKRKDTCRGDSGGGLFCLDPSNNRWQLYGITNFGSARGCGSSYGVYTRVPEVSNWIKEIISKSSNEYK